MRPKPDLVIAAIAGYRWEQIRPWVISLQQSGFSGDIVLLAAVRTLESFTLECVTNRNVKVVPFNIPDNTSAWNFTSKERYIPLLQFLLKHRKKYRFVIWTDVSDLVFQSNPSEWLERHLDGPTIVAARECWHIKDETTFNLPWATAAFPDDIHWLQNQEILCGGTLAGDSETVFQALGKIFKITSEHPEYADQAVVNYVLHKPFNFPVPTRVYIPTMIEGWTATCSAFHTDASGPTELCDLAIKYRTDKVAQFRHHYTPSYHELLKDRRGIKKVLEIGIGYPNPHMAHMAPFDYQAGASLRMWQEYFPDAEIYGLDVEPSALVNEGRIKSFLCDQSDPDSVQQAVDQIGGNFDLIVDDGSHEIDDQVLTAIRLMPLLAADGIYVIEDIINSDMLVARLPFACEVQNFDASLGDDTLVIIRKGQTSKPSNKFNSCCPREAGVVLTDETPVFDQERGLVLTPDGKTPFCIVHQFNRDGDWVRIIPEKYAWD